MFHYPNQTKAFIIQSLISSCGLLLFLPFLIHLLTIRYPETEKLNYEICTYLSYEYKYVGRGSYQYRIFVEEYDEPLIIDNIVQRKTNETLLKSLKSGEELKISIDNTESLHLYEISARGDEILSYENYLLLHSKNDRVGIIFTSLSSAIFFTLLVTGIIYYKKTGNALRGFS